MMPQWIKITILSLVASSASLAQDKTKRPRLECQDPYCVHTVGSNWKNTGELELEKELKNPQRDPKKIEMRLRKLQGSTYKRFRITNTRTEGIKARQYGTYYPRTDEFVSLDGRRRKAREVFNDWDPETEGPAWTDGVTNDKVNVGYFHLRETAPYGNLYTKGWFGSDEDNHMKFKIPPMRSTWERWNHWSHTNIPHRGEATLYHKITCDTMLLSIGGLPGGWFGTNGGQLIPDVRNRNTIRNVEGTPSRGHATVKYDQNHKTSTAISIGGNGGVSVKEGVEVGIKVGFEGTISSKTPFVNIIAKSEADVNGNAESTASIESENNINLFMFTNDMVAAWNISVELERETLDIGSKKPVSSNEWEPDSSGSPSTPKEKENTRSGKLRE